MVKKGKLMYIDDINEDLTPDQRAVLKSKMAEICKGPIRVLPEGAKYVYLKPEENLTDERQKEAGKADSESREPGTKNSSRDKQEGR